MDENFSMAKSREAVTIIGILIGEYFNLYCFIGGNREFNLRERLQIERDITVYHNITHLH